MSIHLDRAAVLGLRADESALAKASEVQPNETRADKDVAKVGARKNKQDAADIQDMHDKCMKLAGGMHCAAQMKDNENQGESTAKPGFTTEQAEKAAELHKRGARHSAADQSMIKAAHDAMVGLGADCEKAYTAYSKTAAEDKKEADEE